MSGRAKRVKRFERSNGLDTALYKNYLFTFYNSRSVDTHSPQYALLHSMCGVQMHVPWSIENQRILPTLPLPYMGSANRILILHLVRSCVYYLCRPSHVSCIFK